MKGICFKECLFNKTIEGGKIQTRRIMVSHAGTFNVHTCKDGTFDGAWKTDEEERELQPLRPRYQPGDVAYLKEPYAFVGGTIIYKYGTSSDKTTREGITWKNKLFMPESAARYFIEFIDYTADKLQNIPPLDCKKEGIFQHISHGKVHYKNGYDGLMYESPIDAYAALIDRINGHGTWESNPWVWVYNYKLFNKKQV